MKRKNQAVRTLGLGMLVGLMVGCAAPAKVATIDPGERAGGVRLGMTLGEVKILMGESRAKKKLENGISYSYPSAGLIVYAPCDEDKGDTELGARVSRISCGTGYLEDATWMRNYWGQTKEGIGIGAAPEEVIKVYGVPPAGERLQDYTERTREGNYVYPAKGILFHFYQDQLVRMTIFPVKKEAATAPAAQK